MEVNLGKKLDNMENANSSKINADATCISCAKVLQTEKINSRLEDQVDLDSPIHNGIYLAFYSYGNYGSRILDYSSYGIQGYLCDECFLQKSDRLYVWNRGDEDNKYRVGIRLSEYEDFKNSRFVTLGEKHGPAYLAQYVNGEYWIDGVRYYREITSEQRSEAEKILMEENTPVVAVPRELLNSLLGALRAAEYNEMELKSSIRKTQYENETLKEQLAGAPREIETLAILHKEASELSVTELREIMEDARWARKIQNWMAKNPLFHENGTALDTMHLWVELTQGSEGLQKFMEQEKLFIKKFETLSCSQSGNEANEASESNKN